MQPKAQLLKGACLSIGKALLMLRNAHARGLQPTKHASSEDYSATIEDHRQAMKATVDHLSPAHDAFQA